MAHKQIPEFFINAFYESKFKDAIFVIKASGKIIDKDQYVANLLSNIRDLTHRGIKVLLIYGGGKPVDLEAEKRGIEVKKVEGRRITDAASMDVMRQIIGGELSLQITSAMAKAKLEGVSLNAVPSEWMSVKRRPAKPVDFGLVGDIHHVHIRPIHRLFKFSNFIACSCLCVSEDGDVLNINADTVATQLACALKAHKLIMISDVDGVFIGDTLVESLTDTQIDKLIDDGVATGGMQVKLQNCKKALEAGVRRIHLISGLRKDALETEIFQSYAPCTILFTEDERQNYENEREIQKLIEGRS